MSDLQPPKRRGRPKGASTAVVKEQRLGVHQFAFLRATIQGMDLGQAWKRFMAFTEYTASQRDLDLRVVARQRDELLEAVLARAESANSWLPEHLHLGGPIATLRAAAVEVRRPAPAVQAYSMTFEEWQADRGYTEDDMSIEAQVREWKEDCHIDRKPEDEELAADGGNELTGSAAENSISARIRALNAISAHIAQVPRSEDQLSLWLHPTTVRRLAEQGVETIQDLVAHINHYGYNWYRRTKGLGERSAVAISNWLQDSAEFLQTKLWPSSLQPPGRIDATSTDLVPLPRFGIVPLGTLAVPPWLDGSQGTFRTHMPNTLGARNDLEAIHAWLRKHEEHRHTYRSYAKEAERFYLWCLNEAKVPLSSVTSPLCQDYRKFLSDIPPSWIQPPTARRSDDNRWRPFRKQLSPSSIKQAIVIIQSLFAGLQEAGYLVANPMSAVSKGFALPSSGIDVSRSLTTAEWDHVRNYLEASIEGAAQRRLRALLSLLVGTGLRLEELARATWGQIVRVDVDDEAAWMLTVVGKRNKKREVSIPPETLEVLQEHRLDFRISSLIDPSDPLIGRIGAPIREASTGEAPSPALPVGGSRPAQTNGLGMSAGGIYMVLRRFFRAAACAAPPHISAEHLSRASTHWLRHTFGRQGAQAGIPVEVLQQALGHSSLTTTGIYLSTERDRLVREMRKLQAAR